jgi:predicted SprT family Zn-dependent metalloprotease
VLSVGETMKRLERGVKEAREFFGIDPLYDVEIFASLGEGEAAQIDAGSAYLRCTIKVNLDYYQVNPQYIRRDMAHEVAHLVSNEIMQLRNRMPEEWREDDQPAGGMFEDAIETLTCRLERLYLRERPAKE